MRGWPRLGAAMSTGNRPAFPQQMVDVGHGPEFPEGHDMGGLTLLEYFTGKALTGLLSCPDSIEAARLAGIPAGVGVAASMARTAVDYAEEAIDEIDRRRGR